LAPPSPDRTAPASRWPWRRSTPRAASSGASSRSSSATTRVKPPEAVKHAQELVESEKVVLIAGTFLSNVGLAVSDWAKQNKTMFVAAEPLTEALTWAKGHDYVVRLRPTPTSRGACSPRRRAR